MGEEMADAIELMALYWTTSGIYPSDGEIGRYEFKERVEAAARAGFKGVGLWHTELEHCMHERSLSEMKTILDDNGIKHLELEFLTDWFLEGGRKSESDNRKKRLLEASQALGAKHVKIGDFYNSPFSMAGVTDAFGALCAEADSFGATIGFEVMGSSMINNLSDAMEVVRGAGARNGGLIIDIVQVVVLGWSCEEISLIPAEHLVCVELNDGMLPGSPGYDPSNRLFCGDGEYDLKGFIECVRKIGYSGPWAVEVINRDHAKLPLHELTTRAFDTTMAQLVT
jgi:sugar phosphate isomerase/epimerase